MSRSLVGKRIAIKPSAGVVPTDGTVRGVSGTGDAALFEVDAFDRTGYRSTLYLVRREFTMQKPA